MIESAWDKGINDTGRVETGGIRGTRKYIGTPEARKFYKAKSHLLTVAGSSAVGKPGNRVSIFSALFLVTTLTCFQMRSQRIQ